MTALPTPADPHSISRADLWPEERYAAERRSLRGELVAQKKYRRVEVGPHAVFYFENWLTMWMQIQEMLHIEKGGDEQVEDELSAYGSLIPQGNELVATVMFEIPDEERRKKILATLGGVEETMFLEIDGARVVAIPEQDVDRTTRRWQGFFSTVCSFQARWRAGFRLSHRWLCRARWNGTLRLRTRRHAERRKPAPLLLGIWIDRQAERN